MTVINLPADLWDVSALEDFYDRETIVRRVVMFGHTKIS
jgi:hypothetical protein